MKQNTLLITLAVIGLIMLVGCGVAPVQSTAAEAVEVINSTTRVVKSDPVLITSAERVPGVWRAALTQGQPVIGRYEAQPLPNGEVTLKLESDNCHLSSLIVSAGEAPGILLTESTQGQSVVGLYKIQSLPNGEMMIKFENANITEELSC